MEFGIQAIFGPSDPLLGAHIQSICEALDIPHVETRIDFEPTFKEFSINLHPSQEHMNHAFKDVMTFLNWTKVAIIYEEDYGKMYCPLNIHRDCTCIAGTGQQSSPFIDYCTPGWFIGYSDWATGWRIRGSNFGSGKWFSLIRNENRRLGGGGGLLLKNIRIIPRGLSGRGVILTTSLHLAPRCKNEWACTSVLLIRLHGNERQYFTF